MATLTMDTDQIRTLVQEGIIAQLSEESKQSILTQALSHLLTKNKPGYGIVATTPLEDAFNVAVRQVAVEIAQELVVENPEIRDKVKAQLVVAVESLVNTNALSSALHETIRKALTGESY